MRLEMKLSKIVNPLFKSVLTVTLMVPLLLGLEASVIGVEQAQAQEAEKPKRKAKRVETIRAKYVKDFEKIQAAFEIDDHAVVNTILDKLEKVPELNNIERAYIHNYRGNICFEADNLKCALREFKLVTRTREGLSDAFYNQMLYVIAQVYFSQENYKEALNYAQIWFKTQAEPPADAYMLIGQAYYMLKNYDAALPNVQNGIQKYIDLGSVPKEGWLNLLSNIYRQKNDFRKMQPVVKQLVLHYPKKTYLLTLAGIYNELDDQQKMTAMYQAMYDQGILTSESEVVTLASLQMSQDNPFKASAIMEKGISSGAVKTNLKNWRVYAQSLFMAREYEKALGPLENAAKLAKNGKLYNQLGQSYMALNQWREAETAIVKAINKGKLGNTGQTVISLGMVQFEQKKYDSAKASFNKALRYDSVAAQAGNWIKYVDNEVYRIRELEKEIIINTDVEPLTS
ncbi:MAG: tetratricopeptide (TPR) repeat protein [Cryomorphaceae bacterium]|jgi:tetratricopeptide (TPR) repeat protein